MSALSFQEGAGAAPLTDLPRSVRLERCYVGDPLALPACVPETTGSAMQEAFGASGTHAYRRRAVQECLDLMGNLRTYREPQHGEAWTTPLASERRLLAQVDAVLGLGSGALEQAVAQALDPDVPDPGRVFAALFTLGCVEGDDWHPALLDIFTTAVQRHPEEAACATEALSLSPCPALGAAVRPLLGHGSATLRAAAVRVLSFRGELLQGDWERALLDPHPAVVAAASAAPLGAYERDRCERPLLQLIESPIPEPVLASALRSAFSLRFRIGYDHALRIAQSSQPFEAQALHSLALFGNPSDAQRIRPWLEGNAHPQAVQAAGTLGSVNLVPPLLDLLERSAGDPGVAARVQQALWQITGLEFEADDTDRARGLWARHASQFDPAVRYRAGRPYGAATLRDLLHTGPGRREQRQQGHLELCACVALTPPRFSAYDFIGVQRQSLDRIDRWLDTAAASAARGH